jgi:hypothetical protein
MFAQHRYGDLKEVLIVLELYWFYSPWYISLPSNSTQLTVQGKVGYMFWLQQTMIRAISRTVRKKKN